MLIDITLKITSEMVANAKSNEKKVISGHLGTHFDVMNKEFPLQYIKRKGIIFDISNVNGREIDLCDIDLNKIEKDMFVAFYSGTIEKYAYGTKTYSSESPQLSFKLIEALLKKEISIIGIDFVGLRHGKEHPLTDQHLADNGVFVVENLCNLKTVLENSENFVVYTFPMNYAEMSGLPCRVVAEV